MIVVIDTCVLRRALEHEKSIKTDDESCRAYEFVAKLLQKNVTFVANSETKREYYRHIEALKSKLGKMRVYPQSIALLRQLIPKLKAVPDENYEFEFIGEPIGRKDYHLLNSAKSGALRFREYCAFVLTFARDVYRVKCARDGKGIEVVTINLAEVESPRKRINC